MADSQRLQQLSSAPAGPVAGTVYFDTTKHALGVYDGTVWVYGSSTAWGPSGGTTEIDGNLTLGGKPVSAVPPSSGGPYYLEYNGTDWIAATISGGGGSELNGDTLNGGTIAATTPTSGFPYALVWNGTDWVSEAVIAQPGSGFIGGVLASTDTAGDPKWVGNGMPDVLQGGFVTGGSAVTATINSSTGVLTFTNWPTSAIAWWYPTGGSSLIRGNTAGAPTPTVSGVTSGDYAYLAMYSTCPSTPDGTGGTSLVVGTSRTTAALAAADQVGAAAQNGKTLVWDSIAHLAAGVWTLVAGTPASGSIIPAATGRDRRPWAKGAFADILNSGSTASASPNGGYAVVDAILNQRIECSGLPLRLRYFTVATGSASAAAQIIFFQDGAQAGLSNSSATVAGVARPFQWESLIIPSAGSHLFQPAWFTPSGSLTSNAVSFGDMLTIEELRPGAANGAA